jgi:hypothetical protein
VDADTLVFLLAAVLIVAAEVLIVVFTRPRPRGALEVLYLVLPAAGAAALLVAAWHSLS